MAATGTPTTNIGLRRPQGTDPASVDDINYNSELIDTKLGAVGSTSVQEQINTLNSNMAKGAYTSWGTSLTANNFHIGLVLIGNVAAYEVWFASTADINIRSLRASDSAKAGTNTVSFGPDIITDNNYTITRNGTTLTLTATTNSTLAILYV